MTWKRLLQCMAVGGLGLTVFAAVAASSDGSDRVKVEICHIPPGNPENAHVIRVSENAMPAHLQHGDPLQPGSLACDVGEGVCNAVGTLSCTAVGFVCDAVAGQPTEPQEVSCADAQDNDCDGLQDAQDPDCAGPMLCDSEGGCVLCGANPPATCVPCETCVAG